MLQLLSTFPLVLTPGAGVAKPVCPRKDDAYSVFGLPSPAEGRQLAISAGARAEIRGRLAWET